VLQLGQHWIVEKDAEIDRHTNTVFKIYNLEDLLSDEVNLTLAQ